MTLIQKLQRLPCAELSIIEELFDSITEGAFLDVFRELGHDPKDRRIAARALELLQHMEEEDADALAPPPPDRPDWLSDTMMLRLAYKALCENEHAMVPGIPDYPPPFHGTYDTTRLLQAMEKQRVHLPYGH